MWKDELYLEYHQGTFTTQAAMKKYNRSNEVLLSNVEKFSSISSLFGGTYNRASIEEAWKKTLFNQFHDILPGSSIREVYVDSKETFKESEAIGQFELKNTLESFSKKISLPSNIKGTPLVVFNALSWQRTDVVRFDLPTGSTEDFAVFDIKGKEIASQIVQKDRFTRELLFIASDIPSMGYKTYIMKKQKAASPKTSLIVSTLDIENAFFKITVCPKSGHLKSIVDKRNGKEILKGLGNRLQLLEDLPKAWDAWNIGWTGVEFPTRFLKAEIVEIGPVRAVIRLHRDYRKPGTRAAHPTTDFPTSFFTQDVILYDGIDRIDFKTDVDWWENKTMLKVAFPLTVSDTVATYEIPYGTVQRSTQWRNSWDSAKVEVPAVRWADLSQDDYGVSLLNNSKYGHDIKDNTIRLSLLRSPKWPDPTADRGKHSIEYSLYPHKNRWAESGTVQRGYEFNNPLIAVIAEASKKGTLPVEQSFVQLSPSNCILAMFKKAEEGDAYVIQWYESEGKDVTATLTLPKQPRKAVLSNFIEADGAEVKVEKNKLVMPTKRNAVVTVKLWF
jgi:alpha-mannosidase